MHQIKPYLIEEAEKSMFVIKLDTVDHPRVIKALNLCDKFTSRSIIVVCAYVFQQLVAPSYQNQPMVGSSKTRPLPSLVARKSRNRGDYIAMERNGLEIMEIVPRVSVKNNAIFYHISQSILA